MKFRLTIVLIVASGALALQALADDQAPNAPSTGAIPGPLVAASPIPVAQNFTVGWDWTRDPNYFGVLTGYHVKWGTTTGGPYPNSVDVLGESNKTKAFTNFALGRAYMVVTSYDSKAESTPSNELVLDVSTTVNGPANLRVTSGNLANLSTRGHVGTGDDVLIGGFIIQGSQLEIALRALGPSLGAFGLTPLPDPTITLYDSQGIEIAENDDWKANQAAIEAAHLAPTNDKESALIASLAPGAYTAIVRGKGNANGIGMVELYDITP